MSNTILRHDEQEINAPFHVKSTAVSLVVTVMISMYYFANVIPLLSSDDALPEGSISLILSTVILSIILQSTLQIVLFVGAGKIEARSEQDKQASAKSTRDAHFVMSAGIILTIMMALTLGFTMFQTINCLLLVFLLSEVIHYASQLIYYYRHNA